MATDSVLISRPLDPDRPWRVNLSMFEGPLDLLLYLIKKHELDIWDIPIARITQEYLQAIEHMQALNLDIAGEFLVMAATLTTVKSRMLLPVSVEGGETEVEDPRTELVERLLEYQRYRDVADALSKRAVLGRDVFERGQSAINLPEGIPLVLPEATLFEMLTALQEVLERAKARGHIHHILAERFSVVERIHWLHDCLRSEERTTFRSLFRSLRSRMEIVLTFLAMLEMVKAGIVVLERVYVGTRLDGTALAPVEEELLPINDADWTVRERLLGAELVMDWRGID